MAAIFTSSVDKRAHAEIHQVNQDLERRVAERTSELTTTNAALAESEERFRRLVEALPDALFVVCEERVVFVNPSGVKMLAAQRPEQIVGKDLSEIIHPGSLVSIRRRIRDSSQTGAASPPMEHVLLALDGSSVEIESASIPILWQGSLATEAIVRDIRERKRSEARLREYEKAVENLEETIIVVDRNYCYVLANQAFLNRHGLEREQVLGRLVSEVLNPGVFENLVKEQLDECLQGRVVTHELKYKYPKLGERDLFLSYFPIEGPNGIDRVVCVLRDVTERKQAEEALRTSEREQHKIAEQLEIERARLIEAQAVAKVGSWETELPSLDITWSEQTHRIFETDPSYFHPTRPGFVELVHPEDRAKVDAAFQASLEKGTPSTVEYRIVMADGRVKVLEEHWKVFHDEQGRPARLIGTCQDITERKQAERAALRLAAIVESSDDAIISKDPNGMITSWNAGAQRMFGYTETEVVGRSITIIIPSELQDEEASILQRLRAGKHIQHYETVRLTKQGKRVNVSLTISPIKDSQGKVVGASKIARDITERKQAEEALKRSEAEARARAEELAVFFDAVPGMALISRDPACRRIIGSRVAYELLRLPHGANISKTAPEGERPSNFRVVRDGQELPPTELPLQKAAATGQEVRDAEYALLFDDGTSRDIFGNAVPLLDHVGNVRGATGVFVDITERKQAEKSLQLFRMLLDQSSDAIEVVDPETLRFIDVNGRACTDLGYSREELLSMKIYDISPNAESLNARVTEELRTSGSAVFESLHRRKNGSTFPVEVSIKQVTLDRTYRVSVIRDITERKRAEQALLHSQAELARIARIATMGELTASIAHEINQPLAAVAANASASLRWLAVQPPNLDEARQAMANAMNDANRASGVIDRLRTLLQKARPQLRPVDVNEVIRDVLTLANRELITGGVATRTDLAPDLPTVLGDRIQLQQVMLNLIMNAIDAMITIKDRPRTLLIKSASDAEGVAIEIHDSGRGLDAKQASHIFDSFFTTKPEGIGMGLSISRSIVEAHGGRLRAEPGSSHGAVFQVILPKAA